MIERARVAAPPCEHVVEASSGILTPPQLASLDAWLRAGRPAWVYWPREQTLEGVDRERLDSYRRLARVAAALGPAARLAAFVPRRPRRRDPVSPVTPPSGVAPIRIDDADKAAAQRQWDHNPVGTHYAQRAEPHTLAWFLEIERHRYRDYAPWMPSLMEFDRHAGEDVLEIGGGVGTDLAQFARHGARVTDVDLSAGHLQLAAENVRLRGLDGRFVHDDGEALPFPSASFDLVYANGVIHHTPDTPRLIAEIHRVLRPGGRVIAMVYAESSWHYWREQVWRNGLVRGRLANESIGAILSDSVEVSANDARPLVKVYSRERLLRLFAAFADVTIVQRQLTAAELPLPLRPFRSALERVAGWNLIVKGRRP